MFLKSNKIVFFNKFQKIKKNTKKCILKKLIKIVFKKKLKKRT